MLWTLAAIAAEQAKVAILRDDLAKHWFFFFIILITPFSC
jgi:hypothetical protein